MTLRVIGLENALFWSFLIFFLNYIPTIGSIAAVVLTTAVALVQFNTLAPVVAVAAGVGVWQFVIGNFLQPRMTGDSLNLSAVVVLLALGDLGRDLGHRWRVSRRAAHSDVDDCIGAVSFNALDRNFALCRWQTDAASTRLE